MPVSGERIIPGNWFMRKKKAILKDLLTFTLFWSSRQQGVTGGRKITEWKPHSPRNSKHFWSFASTVVYLFNTLTSSGKSTGTPSVHKDALGCISLSTEEPPRCCSCTSFCMRVFSGLQPNELCFLLSVSSVHILWFVYTGREVCPL